MPSVLWIVPPAARGSGGHRTIFNHANFMAEQGCDVTIAFENANHAQGHVSRNLKDYLEERYGKLNAEIVEGCLLDREFDLGIATFWTTVFPLLKTKAKNRLYFVQDYEPWFYPFGDEYLLCQETYRMLDNIVCIGRWLPNKLRESGCNANISYFDFGVDEAVYHHRNLPRSNSICVLYQPEKHRRCPLLVESTVQVLKRQRPDIEINVFGSRTPLAIDGVNNLGVLSEDQLGELYNSSKVGLSISSSNPSRIPFEMMACGLPVVELAGPNTAYDFGERTVSLAEPMPTEITGQLLELYQNNDLWQTAHSNSLAYMEPRTSSNEYQMFYGQVVEQLLGKNKVQTNIPRKTIVDTGTAGGFNTFDPFYLEGFDFMKLQPRVAPKKSKRKSWLFRGVKGLAK